MFQGYAEHVAPGRVALSGGATFQPGNIIQVFGGGQNKISDMTRQGTTREFRLGFWENGGLRVACPGRSGDIVSRKNRRCLANIGGQESAITMSNILLLIRLFSKRQNKIGGIQ